MSTLNSYASADLGTSQIAVYTCPGSKVAVIVGSNIANKLDVSITVDIKIRKGGTDYWLLRQVLIPPFTAYVSSGDEQKTVLNAGDSIQMKSSAVASADILMSVSEFADTV
jgi:hypothetical protein